MPAPSCASLRGDQAGVTPPTLSPTASGGLETFSLSRCSRASSSFWRHHIHCGFPLKCNTNWQAASEGRMRITGQSQPGINFLSLVRKSLYRSHLAAPRPHRSTRARKPGRYHPRERTRDRHNRRAPHKAVLHKQCRKSPLLGAGIPATPS